MSELTLADPATVANMSPEFGATMGFFPVDRVTLQYLRMTSRDEKRVISAVNSFEVCVALRMLCIIWFKSGIWSVLIGLSGFIWREE